MATRSYVAARTSGNPGSWTVTRSTDDGLPSGAVAAFLFDSALSKLQLAQTFKDLMHELNQDWDTVSKPVHLDSEAFDDDADFDDGSVFADQGTDTYLATLGISASTVTRDDSRSIGSADAALLPDVVKGKIEIRSAIKAIQFALSRDAMSATEPASYPVSGSVVV